MNQIWVLIACSHYISPLWSLHFMHSLFSVLLWARFEGALRPASTWRRIEVRKVIKYVIDETFSSALRQIWSEELIVEKKVLPRVSGMSRLLSSGTRRRRAGKRPKTGISPSYIQERYSNDNGTTSYLLVTAATLTSHLAYLRQAMAMLHVVYASISILLDMEVRG